MIIQDEHLSALLLWLTRELEPLTLADPATLAEYVLALLKNDKENEDLKVFCTEQLSDFLKENTKSFVRELFQVLSDGSYLQDNIKEDENDVDSRVEIGRRRHDDEEEDDDWRRDNHFRRKTSIENQYDEDNSARKRRRDDDTKPSHNTNSLANHAKFDRPSSGRNHIDQRNSHIPSSSNLPRRYDNWNDRDTRHDELKDQSRRYGAESYRESNLSYPVYPPIYPHMLPHPDEYIPTMSQGGYSFHAGMMQLPVIGMGGYHALPIPSKADEEFPMVPHRPPGPPPVSIGNVKELGDGPQSEDLMTSKPSPPPGPMPTKTHDTTTSIANNMIPNTWNNPRYPPLPYYTAYDPMVTSPTTAQPFGYGSLYQPLYSPFDTASSSIPLMQPSQPTQNHRGPHAGHRRSGGSNQLSRNELPESERCTLLCTGIPTYVKEEEIMAHFRSFGRVVQLQITPSESPTAVTTTTDGISGTGEKDKKTYNECLVQFDSADNAKKCYSSPTAVLNNRFIRIQQSSFNIIPPADVPPPTEEELIELEKIQNQIKSAPTGKPLPLHPNALKSRHIALRPAIAVGGKFAKNKKYIAGVTVNTEPVLTSPITKLPEINETINSLEEHPDGNDTDVNQESDISNNDNDHELNLHSPDSGTINKNLVNNTSEPASSNPLTSIHDSVASVTITSKSLAKISPSAAKADLALQQQYGDLRKLRNQMDAIWKTKQTVLQSQIDKYKELIADIERSSAHDDDAKNNVKMIEELEGKIVDLQSQLRSLQEQRESGTIQNQQQIQLMNKGSALGGDYYGGRGRSIRGRFPSRGYFPGRIPARMNGRWRTAARGVPNQSKNLTFDNRPKSLLIPASEWTRLPASFASNIQINFSRFGEIKSMSSLSNGDIVIEYNTRKEAESAKSNGAVHESVPLKIEWYQQPLVKEEGSNNKQEHEESSAMMIES